MNNEYRPLISVIIASYNDSDKIGKCIEALLDQNYENIEIIIVDDGSEDNTKDFMKSFDSNKKVFFLQQKRQGPGTAKNKAVKEAKGEILVFVDADEYVKKDYLEKLTEPIRKGEAKTCIGAWVIANPKSPWARCRFKETHKLRHHAVNSGVFRAIKKEFFEELGGFDSSKGYSDDRIPNNEKRARIDDAIFNHDVDSNPKDLFQKRKWIGSSLKTNPKNSLFWKKIVFGFLFFALFVISFWINIWMSLGILIGGLFPIIYRSFKKAFVYKDIRLVFYYPLYLFITSLGMILGFLNPEYKKDNLNP